MALGAAHKDALSLRASLAEAAARAGGSVRARERVGSSWGQLSTRPWQSWESFSIWVASLLPSSSSLQASAHLPLLLLCWPWVQGCAAAGHSKGLGAPAKPLCSRAACPLPPDPSRHLLHPHARHCFDRKLKITVPGVTCAGSTHRAEDVPGMATRPGGLGQGYSEHVGQRARWLFVGQGWGWGGLGHVPWAPSHCHCIRQPEPGGEMSPHGQGSAGAEGAREVAAEHHRS